MDLDGATRKYIAALGECIHSVLYIVLCTVLNPVLHNSAIYSHY
jgi:hypothetical protein